MKTTLAFILAFALVPQCLPEDVMPIASVTKSHGVVRVFHSSDIYSGFEASIGTTLNIDSLLQTGSNSKAELEFADMSLTRIGSNTIFSFSIDSKELELKQGSMLLQLFGNNRSLKIKTAAVTAAVTGTTVYLEHNRQGVTTIHLLETDSIKGLVLTLAGDSSKTQIIKPGESIKSNGADFSAIESIDRAYFWQNNELGASFGELKFSMDKIFKELEVIRDKELDNEKTAYEDFLNKLLLKASSAADSKRILDAILASTAGESFYSLDGIGYVKLDTGMRIPVGATMSTGYSGELLLILNPYSDFYQLPDTLINLSSLTFNLESMPNYSLSNLDYGTIIAAARYSTPISISSYQTLQGVFSLNRGTALIQFSGQNGLVVVFDGELVARLHDGSSFTLYAGDALELNGLGSLVQSRLRAAKSLDELDEINKTLARKNQFLLKNEDDIRNFFTLSQSTQNSPLFTDYVIRPIDLDALINQGGPNLNNIPPAPVVSPHMGGGS